MTHPLLPPSLNPGDTIGIMAPSSRVDISALEAGADTLRQRGYNVFLHPQSRAQLHQSAGTNEEKIAAFHDLIRDPAIKAILFATGGNRALHLLDHLDYDLIRSHPKILMGFSDNTALLNAISARTGLVTYHGPTAKRLPRNPQLDFNLRLLAGQESAIPLTGATIFRPGKAEGLLIGGNLSLFQYLVDSGETPNPNGAILFLEDIGEEYSRLDRDFCFLRRSGLLDKISGLILGQFTDLLDTGTPFGFTFEDIINEHTAGLNIPILMNAPFGHAEDLYALPIGRRAALDGLSLRLL